MAELDLDMTPDPVAESPLLAEGSDGLVGGSKRHILETLHEYHEQGHSLRRIRRDFALSPDVTPRQIADAAEYGRRLRVADGDYLRAATRIPSRPRVFGGIDPLPTRAEYEARQKAQAAQEGGVGDAHPTLLHLRPAIL